MGAGTRADIIPAPACPFPGLSVEIRLAAVEVIFGQRFVPVVVKQIHHFRNARFVAAPDQVQARVLHAAHGVR